MTNSLLIPSFFFQIILLYFISRKTINNLFHLLRTFLKNDHLVFSLISIIFFPGTVVHELAHFFTAIILFLRVHSLSIFPKWERNEIKLGTVLYEKKDFVRGVLVGIAPIFSGIFFLWAIAAFNIFPSDNIFFNLLIIYLIFTVSSMMFSSKRDLIDLIYIIPFLVILYGFIYIFDIKLDFIFHNQSLEEALFNFLKQVNMFLLISIGVNLTLLFFLFLVKKMIVQRK